MRVAIRASARQDNEFEAFIERLRCDVFELYASVRAAQRERHLPAPDRLRLLGEACREARLIVDAIDRRRAAAVFDLDPADAFGVPI
jgi:hypothetical protein